MYRQAARYAPETTAFVLAGIAVIAGMYLAVRLAPVWLNRAGAIVIIIGVLLAASKFQDWVQQKVRAYVDADFERVATNVLNTEFPETAALASKERAEILGKVRSALERDLSAMHEQDKRRLGAWEVGLVVLGTFLNGFGDWLVTLAQPVAT